MSRASLASGPRLVDVRRTGRAGRRGRARHHRSAPHGAHPPGCGHPAGHPEPRQVRARHRRRARCRGRPAQQQRSRSLPRTTRASPTAAQSTSPSRGRATAARPGTTSRCRASPRRPAASGTARPTRSSRSVPDGTAYLSVLVVSLKLPVRGRRAALARRRPDVEQAVLRRPAHELRVLRRQELARRRQHKSSPHYGRLYQFWTPFISNGNKFIGDPQAVRWSDDHGTTWSATHFLTAKDRGTQNSQPMILPNGHIVDTFYDYGQGQRSPDAAPGGVARRAPGARRQQRAFVAPRATINATGPIESVISTDGGATWSPESEVVNNGGGYADGVRCCLFGADIDAVTHRDVRRLRRRRRLTPTRCTSSSPTTAPTGRRRSGCRAATSAACSA